MPVSGVAIQRVATSEGAKPGDRTPSPQQYQCDLFGLNFIDRTEGIFTFNPVVADTLDMCELEDLRTQQS